MRPSRAGCSSLDCSAERHGPSTPCPRCTATEERTQLNLRLAQTLLSLGLGPSPPSQYLTRSLGKVIRGAVIMRRLTTARAAGLVTPWLALLLAACNVVFSNKPWFTRADTADAPRLREGVWLGSSSLSTPCSVDERQPIDAWPDCARPVLVRKFDLVELSKANGRWQQTRMRYVLAGGEPFILQVGATLSGKAEYLYEWVRVNALDDQGRVTSYAGWFVLCGSAGSGSTTSIYPGLVKQDDDCTASSIAALRGAAKASDADATDIAQAHWVRDGSQ
jgi:hypothetical protein